MTATDKHQPTTAEGLFAKAIEDKFDQAKPPAFVIPILSADPPETDPTNLWMRWDGRLRGRRWNGASYSYTDYPLRTDITSPPAVPAYPAAPAQPPAPTTYVSTYQATWSQGYQGDDQQRANAVGYLSLPYGNDGTAYGQQKSLIGFDYASIVTDLTGSTVKQVQLTLSNTDSYAPSVAIYFGLHAETAKPTTWPSSGIQRFLANDRWVRTETKTINLPLTFATSIRGGTARGISIEAPSASLEGYGIAAGVNSGITPPQLTITYAK